MIKSLLYLTKLQHTWSCPNIDSMRVSWGRCCFFDVFEVDNNFIVSNGAMAGPEVDMS